MTQPSAHPPIPTLTLDQPWATLVADLIKLIETRSWKPADKHIGTRIAIHAGRRLDRHPNSAILQHLTDTLGISWQDSIPRGAVIATATLKAALQVRTITDNMAYCHNLPEPVPVDPYGDFTPGRWLWFLEDIIPCTTTPARGFQKIWTWHPPQNWDGPMPTITPTHHQPMLDL